VIFLARKFLKYMNIKDLEDLIKEQINNVIVDILSNNPNLNISAKSRAGAEISDWIEKRFVEATKNHDYLKDSESAPQGKTKNPWDAKTFFQINDLREEIWIDFKAFKLSGEDSNPDIGTPIKIIEFIKNGSFYLLYVYIYYEEYNNGLRFIQQNDKLTKVYFLKDISNTFRRTPTGQLQVNILAEPTYRTRGEFIDLLMLKIKEGLERQRDSAIKKLNKLTTEAILLKQKNSESEKIILQKLQ